MDLDENATTDELSLASDGTELRDVTNLTFYIEDGVYQNAVGGLANLFKRLSQMKFKNFEGQIPYIDDFSVTASSLSRIFTAFCNQQTY